MAVYTIVCSACGTSAGAHENPQPGDIVRCRKCGQSDTYAAMMADAQDFLIYYANNPDAPPAPAGETPGRKYRWVVGGLGGWHRVPPGQSG